MYVFYFLVQPFYSSSKDFTCLDGSSTVPFSSVNDDYCDCPDGTDEPGEYYIITFKNQREYSSYEICLL